MAFASDIPKVNKKEWETKCQMPFEAAKGKLTNKIESKH